MKQLAGAWAGGGIFFSGRGSSSVGWPLTAHRAEGVDIPFYATSLYVTDSNLGLALVDLDIDILTNENDAPIRAEVDTVASALVYRAEK